jgi:hypothetical protein
MLQFVDEVRYWQVPPFVKVTGAMPLMAAHSSLLVGMIVGLVVGIAASWGLFFGSLDRGAPLADIALNTLLPLFGIIAAVLVLVVSAHLVGAHALPREGVWHTYPSFQGRPRGVPSDQK